MDFIKLGIEMLIVKVEENRRYSTKAALWSSEKWFNILYEIHTTSHIFGATHCFDLYCAAKKNPAWLNATR